MENLEHWIWLQSAFSAGSAKPEALLNKFRDVKSVYEAGPNGYISIDGLTKRNIEALCDKSLEKSKKIIDICLKNNYKIITMQSEDYPVRLRNIYAPPCVLYIMGNLDISDDDLMIAVVGTRQITEYGFEAATKLSMGLARSGVTVVSGLALGVDGAAHKGALKADGKTIAVIGCGLDVNYPSAHVELKRLISNNGAVVSEFPPGSFPERRNFPIRNRIIAGLSQGTLVIEAGTKSGALITALLAAEMGRDVFAVPGSIFNPMSEGPNKLIRDGAKPVCGILDILEEYMDLYRHRISINNEISEIDKNIEIDQSEFKNSDDKQNMQTQLEIPAVMIKKPKKNTVPAGLSDTQAKIYTVLNSSETPIHVDALALKANIELKVVLAVLTALEIQGLARSYPGRRYTKMN